MDICSDNSGGDRADTVNRHRDPTMMQEHLLAFAGIGLIAVIMVTWL